MACLGETLSSFLQRAQVGSQTVSKLTGIPRPSIENWLRGLSSRPRHWRSLLQIGRALALSRLEVDALLAAAEYPSMAILSDILPHDHPDQVYLQPWRDPPPTILPAALEQRLQLLEAQLHRAARPALGHQLRPPVGDFVGRDVETIQLVSGLRNALAEERGAVISGVQGMGGIGKTELAYAVAHGLRDMFPDAQIVLDLRGSTAAPLTRAQALQTLIYMFAPDTPLSDDLPSLERHYRTVLYRQRVLILADDAHNAEQVQALTPPAGSALLLTSRQRLILPGMLTVQLEQLKEEAAIMLLRRICPRLNIAEAAAIAQVCGYLPLALRISASLLHTTPALPAGAYLARLADQRQRLFQLRDPDNGDWDVAASLMLSYMQLDAEAQRVFRQLGVLVADFPTELALAVVDGSAGRTAEENLHLLLRRNMVHYDTGRGRWWLHQLLRDLARHQLERASEWQMTMWRYAQAVVGIARAIQAQYEAGGDAVLAALARFDTERPHVDAGCGWMANHAGTAQGDRLLLDAAMATRYIGTLRYDVQHQRIPLWERARAAAQRLEDRDAEARSLNNLGIAYAQLGNPQQAIPYYEQMLAIVRTSGDRRTEKLALGNLGRAYADLGEPRQAIDYFEQVLAIVRALGDRRMEGIALGNLGNAYTDLGEARRAITYFEEAVALARASGDDTAEGLALGNLGRTYVALGQAGRAISYFTQALALARALGDRRGEGYALHNLGYAYTDLGYIQRAINTCAAAHTIARELGELRLEGYVLSYLARAQARQNNLARATTTFAQAVALLRQVGDRWGEAECQWQVGLALAQQGQRDQALPLLRAAVAYEQEIDHAKVAEHAALLACLEAGAALPADHLPMLSRRVVEQDADMASRVDQLPNREI